MTPVPDLPVDRQASRWRGAIAPLVLLAIVIGFFWKLLLTNQYSWLESPDLAYQVVPWFNYQAVQFHQHVFPIWDPYQFAGQSLIGQDQPGLTYPFNWILFLLPLKNGHIAVRYLNWYYMSIHYLAALFCYWLCRDLGRSRLAAIIGGVSFGLGGYVANIDWPQMINGAIWTPLVFLFLFRTLRGMRPRVSAALSGLFLGVSWLSGHHQVPIFLTLTTTGVWLYFIWERGRLSRQILLAAAVFLTFLIFAGAFQMWPTFEYGHHSVRWVGSQHDPVSWNQPVPYMVHREYSLSPRYLLGMVIPGYQDGGVVFVGIVAFALSGLALARCWGTKPVRVLVAVGMAGLFLALGSNDLFQGILYSVLPVFDKARTPATAIFLFHFAIAVLIGFGMDVLRQPSNARLLRRLALILLASGIVTFFIEFGVFLSHDQKWIGDDRVMLIVIASFALAGLLYRESTADSKHRGIPLLIVALYLLELGNVALYYLPHRDETNRNIYLSHLEETKQVADFLRHQPQPLRVWTNMDDVPFNFGDWYGIDTLDGFVPSVPANFYEIEAHTLRGRKLFGARYSVGRKPLFADQKEIFHDSNGLSVYENPDVLPRTWTVHNAVKVKNAADARGHLQDVNFDLANRTFAYTALPPMDQCNGDEVRSSSRGINWFSAVVSMKCKGMLVMSENYAPGWTAQVDGIDTPVYETYTSLRGVMVGPGAHTVEMRYRPLSVIAGAAATFIAFIAGAILCLIPAHNR